ncbi:hypothetical protein B0H14DRAFT_3072934, partial [Mycena olivaceomarginata]
MGRREMSSTRRSASSPTQRSRSCPSLTRPNLRPGLPRPLNYLSLPTATPPANVAPPSSSRVCLVGVLRGLVRRAHGCLSSVAAAACCLLIPPRFRDARDCDVLHFFWDGVGVAAPAPQMGGAGVSCVTDVGWGSPRGRRESKWTPTSDAHDAYPHSEEQVQVQLGLHSPDRLSASCIRLLTLPPRPIVRPPDSTHASSLIHFHVHIMPRLAQTRIGSMAPLLYATHYVPACTS